MRSKADIGPDQHGGGNDAACEKGPKLSHRGWTDQYNFDQFFRIEPRILGASPPRHWPSSVTESVVLPPHTGKHHAKTSTDVLATPE
jgi:hypothetical protein